MKSRSPHRLFPSVLCGLLVLGAVGCGGGKKGTVSGTVTYDGKKLQMGNVTFVPAKGNPVTAEISEDGTYTAVGVPTGDVKITVETRGAKMALAGMQTGPGPGVTPPKGATLPKDSVPPTQGGGEKFEEMKRKAKLAKTTPDVPESYSKPDSSGLTFTVKSGKQDHNLDLPKKDK